MSEFVYYFLAINSADAVAKADELGMNPNSSNYRTLSDSRRNGMYMMLVVDRVDGYILNSQLEREVLAAPVLEEGAPVHVIH